MGLAAEEAVAAQGLTIGHWPQSVAVSSVGGWVATRASGQFSTAYGNIEDIVHSIEAVLPDGDLVVLGKGPRASAGPDLRHLMMGSEGCLGVITARDLLPAPGGRTAGARAPSRSPIWARASSSSARSSSLAGAAGGSPVRRAREPPAAADGAGSLLLMVHEGPAGLVAAETAAIADLARLAGVKTAPGEIVETLARPSQPGAPLGPDPQPRHRRRHRRDLGPWDRIGAIYQEAVASLKEVEGCLAASAHSSHAYRSGLNLYFTFAVQTAAPAAMEAIYFDCWRRIMEATARHGGGLSHHHGIGRVRRDWLERELGASGVALLRRIKDAIDPDGTMNPGVLIPDA